jgi:allantoinase
MQSAREVILTVPDSEDIEIWHQDPRTRVLYSPIWSRPPIHWPDGARVAVWIVPNIEHYEYQPRTYRDFNVFARVAYPDVMQYAIRDYGNRVGFWRLAEVFDEFGIRPTVALNAAVLDHYPDIRDAMTERNWAFMSHGIYNTRLVFDGTEADERAFFADTIGTIERHTGQRVRGMLGPAISATVWTPDLMTEHGMIYHADWLVDDQPVPILTRTGRLVSVPYNDDINDATPIPMGLDQLAEYYKLQFDRLWAEGEHSGRVMCIPLHPFVTGQPQGVRHLRAVLAHLARHDGVWHTTGEEIATHFLDHHWDDHLEHALRYRSQHRPQAHR